MPMAMKCDVTRTCKAAGRHRPVDLVHLSSQTMGDRNLEREVLALFQSHATSQIREFLAAGSKANRKAIAHSIKGAASGIGAWDLVAIAQSAEHCDFIDDAGFEAEIRNVCDYIGHLLEKNK